jgi:hypothetical protein
MFCAQKVSENQNEIFESNHKIFHFLLLQSYHYPTLFIVSKISYVILTLSYILLYRVL